ncbi:iron-dicitrate transporter ATP-binding subunit [Klebsiella michiganensis]|nr:iron-dicitrate transporter ATP-binding subunit [Klebsiella michiganensis]
MELWTQKLIASYGGKCVINTLDLTLPCGKVTTLQGP